MEQQTTVRGAKKNVLELAPAESEGVELAVPDAVGVSVPVNVLVGDGEA